MCEGGDVDGDGVEVVGQFHAVAVLSPGNGPLN